MDYLVPVNFGCVLLFGISLTLSFGDVPFKTHKWNHFIIWCIFGAVQIVIFAIFGTDILFKAYPGIMHLPLFLILKFYYKKNAYISGISVLSAYLFCTPRKWIGTFVSSFWSYNADVSFMTQIIITLPIFLAITKWVTPYIVRLKYEPNDILKFVVAVPLGYYIIEYRITVYSNLLYTGGAAVVEFMDTFIVVIYLILSMVYLKTLYEKKQVEIEHTVLTVSVDGFKKEFELLKQSHQQASIYRHDLRHHMNYLNACISENKLQEATTYIEQICEDITNTKVVQYTQNEPVNLIVSAYVSKAKERDIDMSAHITAVNFGRFQSTDLCCLLSNALENAMKACDQGTAGQERFIKLRMYEKSNKLCFSISNSYVMDPVFEQGRPVSYKEGHGMGVKSMTHVVEKYQGVYGFSAKDGVFTFQVSM